MSRSTRILAWVWIVIHALTVITIPFAIPWILLLRRSLFQQAIGWGIIIVGAYSFVGLGISGVVKMGHSDFGGIALVLIGLLGAINMAILYRDPPKVSIARAWEMIFNREMMAKYTAMLDMISPTDAIPAAQWQSVGDHAFAAVEEERRYRIDCNKVEIYGESAIQLQLFIDEQLVASHNQKFPEEMDCPYLFRIWDRLVSHHVNPAVRVISDAG